MFTCLPCFCSLLLVHPYLKWTFVESVSSSTYHSEAEGCRSVLCHVYCIGCLWLNPFLFGIASSIVSCSLNGWILRHMHTSLHRVMLFIHLDSCLWHESHNWPEGKPGIKAASRLARTTHFKTSCWGVEVCFCHLQNFWGDPVPIPFIPASEHPQVGPSWPLRCST